MRPDGSGYSNKIGRDNLIDYLGTKKIHTSVHFKPLHLYDLLKDENKTLPVSEKVWVQLISLPCHNGMTDDDIDYVIYWVNRFIEEEYENKLVIGDGLLGKEIVRQTNWDYISRKKDGIDIRDLDSYKSYLDGYDEIINCSRYRYLR